MCGIAGFFLRNKAAQLSDVRQMCAAIRHRGPDDEGFHLDSGCALGMRRLSIIDLKTGHQTIAAEPMSKNVLPWRSPTSNICRKEFSAAAIRASSSWARKAAQFLPKAKRSPDAISAACWVMFLH